MGCNPTLFTISNTCATCAISKSRRTAQVGFTRRMTPLRPCAWLRRAINALDAIHCLQRSRSHTAVCRAPSPWGVTLPQCQACQARTAGPTSLIRLDDEPEMSHLAGRDRPFLALERPAAGREVELLTEQLAVRVLAIVRHGQKQLLRTAVLRLLHLDQDSANVLGRVKSQDQCLVARRGRDPTAAARSTPMIEGRVLPHGQKSAAGGSYAIKRACGPSPEPVEASGRSRDFIPMALTRRNASSRPKSAAPALAS
jgi:hypothetical protein